MKDSGIERRGRPRRPAAPANELLARLDARLERASPDEIVSWAAREFGDELCLATSFGPQSIVLMERVARLAPRTTVFYLDTGLLFPETYALCDALVERLGLAIVRVAPALTPHEQERVHGPELWARDPDRCCGLRKVAPLAAFLRGKHAWITGVRRAHTPGRAGARVVEWDELHGLVKLNPLARWSAAEVWAELKRLDLPYNPLHLAGYPSIGCQPCTRRVRPGEDPRSGRWPGLAKTECGIHRYPVAGGADGSPA
jgi:phosphoadenosine phosphosulfate reductase